MHDNPSRGAIAQLVEQRTENPCVPGSIPGGTTSALRLRRFFWRDGRVVDYSSLENYRTERYRGFESLSLRTAAAMEVKDLTSIFC